MAKSPNLQFMDLDAYKAQIRNRKHSDQPPTDRALTIREVGDKINASRSTIYRWMDEGTFPRGKRFGKCSVRRLESEVDLWMQSQ